MTAVNETRGEFALALGGAEYVLRPSFKAIVEFEGETSKGMLQLLNEASSGSMSLMTAATIVCICLRAGLEAAGDPQAKNYRVERVGELIVAEKGGLALIIKRLELLLLMAATGGYTASGEVKAAGTTTGTPAAG